MTLLQILLVVFTLCVMIPLIIKLLIEMWRISPWPLVIGGTFIVLLLAATLEEKGLI